MPLAMGTCTAIHGITIVWSQYLMVCVCVRACVSCLLLAKAPGDSESGAKSMHLKSTDGRRSGCLAHVGVIYPVDAHNESNG